MPPIRAAHENGHFYSPIVDPSQIREDQVWLQDPHIIGIDFNDASHECILRDVFPQYISGYDYPEHLDETPTQTAFFTQNSQYSWLDARTLYVLLRHWRPRRLIEIGSGYSTLLTADVNRRFLNLAMDVTCVEPFPRQFLSAGVPGVSRLFERRVQEVPLSEFESLEAGDILFIDSSHVAKTGSDVNFLYFEVLPRLCTGVRVHVHDIFLPHDYPREWVIIENRSWNEQYILRALLMHSNAYQVVFGCSYAHWRFPDLVRGALALPKGHAFGGGSFWIERV